MTGRSGEMGSTNRQAQRSKAQTVGKQLANSTNVMGKSLKQNPLTSDNLSKVQEDRYKTFN